MSMSAEIGSGVALVIPLLNEAAHVSRLLADLEGQSRAPDIIVFVDAGSTDGTWSMVEEAQSRDSRIRLLRAPGARPGRGRNLGCREIAAEAEVVVFTDAGISLPPEFVAALSEPILSGRADAALGGYVTDARTSLDASVELLTCCESEVIDGRGVYAPTTAALALRPQVLADVGGFPADLPAFEDALFFARLFASAWRRERVRDLVVTWSMGRGLANLWRKAQRNGRGEAQAGIVSRRTVFVVGLVGLAALVLTPGLPMSAWVRLVLVAALVLWRFSRLRHKNPRHFAQLVRRPAALAWLGPATLLADSAHLWGYLRGLRRPGTAHPWPRLFRPLPGS
jgi:cellulose synthase/poly-beta-1,6-N-acetylglucosamine synthase-like glycosyltransferase